MSGVYIKGMALDEFWEDYGEGASYLCGTGRAVEVPDHGRLIDADELFPLYADLLDGRDVQLVIPKIVIDTAPPPSSQQIRREKREYGEDLSEVRSHSRVGFLLWWYLLH